jgi:hypothetical protein
MSASQYEDNKMEELYTIIGEIRYNLVPVTTAWPVVSLQMDERPADMEGSCEYIE